MQNILKDLDRLIEKNRIDYRIAWYAVCDYRGVCPTTKAAMHNKVKARLQALNASTEAHYKAYLALFK